jgi:hypothetical protein
MAHKARDLPARDNARPYPADPLWLNFRGAHDYNTGALALALLLGGEARLGMVDSGAALLTTPVVTVIITHRPLPFVTGSLSLTSASTLKHQH